MVVPCGAGGLATGRPLSIVSRETFLQHCVTILQQYGVETGLTGATGQLDAGAVPADSTILLASTKWYMLRADANDNVPAESWQPLQRLAA